MVTFLLILLVETRCTDDEEDDDCDDVAWGLKSSLVLESIVEGGELKKNEVLWGGSLVNGILFFPYVDRLIVSMVRSQQIFYDHDQARLPYIIRAELRYILTKFVMI